MKKIYRTLTAGLFMAGSAQAALVSDINNANSATNWSNEVFTGTVTNNGDNWGANDNFTNAVFVSTVMNLGDGTATGNQPFVNATMTGADFTGATFNWNPYTDSGNTRFNIFRDTAGTGVENAGMKFNNSVWNINIAGTSLTNVHEIFLDGAGATTAATAGDALDMSGADFNFTGTTSLSATAATALIDNLGAKDGLTNIGAFYDDTFVSNNFADFGYGDEAALETALDTAGWQAATVPEPSTSALLGFGGFTLIMRRRR